MMISATSSSVKYDCHSSTSENKNKELKRTRVFQMQSNNAGMDGLDIH